MTFILDVKVIISMKELDTCLSQLLIYSNYGSQNV